MKITRRKALAALAGIPALIADGSSAHHGAGGHPTFTPTNTNTPAVPTNTPTNTPVPPTNTPTNTPVPPTATFTPTFTPVPPTATFTPTPVACQNLIANSSFEVPSGTGAANWVRGVRDTTVFRTGVASLKNWVISTLAPIHSSPWNRVRRTSSQATSRQTTSGRARSGRVSATPSRRPALWSMPRAT
jgi:hypothetical protein